MGKTVKGLVFAVVLLAFTLTLIQPGMAEDKVLIGALSAFSGPYASLGEDTVRGSNYAVEEAGGKVLGKPIELVFIDTEVKPGVAARRCRCYSSCQNHLGCGCRSWEATGALGKPGRYVRAVLPLCPEVRPSQEGRKRPRMGRRRQLWDC